MSNPNAGNRGPQIKLIPHDIQVMTLEEYRRTREAEEKAGKTYHRLDQPGGGWFE